MFCRALLFSTVFLLSVALSSAGSTFGPPTSYPVGASICSLAIADYNHDGILDIAAGNKAGGIRVLLGNGDGTFQPGILTRTLHHRFGFACGPWLSGDFNGDGNSDLAVPYDDGNILTLLGNGDGTFTKVGNESRFKTIGRVADFNEDGIPDLMVIPPTACGGVVLLGNGDGTFRDDVTIPVPELCSMGGGPIAVGDINADGHQDVLFSIVCPEGGIVEYDVALGNGDGTFQDPLVKTTVNLSAAAFALGDLNHDGFPELVSANDYTGYIGVQLGIGNGTFSSHEAAYCNTGNYPFNLVLTDFNNDSNLDVAFETSGPFLYVGLGNPDGSITTCSLVDAGPTPSFLATGDLNGDGAPDIVVGNLEPNSTVSVILNTGPSKTGESH